MDLRLYPSSCTREVAVDAQGHVWNFPNWAFPIRLTSSLLYNGSPNTEIKQVVQGQNSCALLMNSGAVRAWWLAGHQTPDPNTWRKAHAGLSIGSGGEIRCIPCVHAECDVKLVQLPTPDDKYGTLQLVCLYWLECIDMN